MAGDTIVIRPVVALDGVVVRIVGVADVVVLLVADAAGVQHLDLRCVIHGCVITVAVLSRRTRRGEEVVEVGDVGPRVNVGELDADHVELPDFHLLARVPHRIGRGDAVGPYCAAVGEEAISANLERKGGDSGRAEVFFADTATKYSDSSPQRRSQRTQGFVDIVAHNIWLPKQYSKFAIRFGLISSGARSRESLWGGMVDMVELWRPMVAQEIQRWTQKTGDFLKGVAGGAMSVRNGGKRP